MNTLPGVDSRFIGLTDIGVYSPGNWKYVVGGRDGTYVPVDLVEVSKVVGVTG